jgi:type VI protein secretion system component Hcp
MTGAQTFEAKAILAPHAEEHYVKRKLRNLIIISHHKKSTFLVPHCVIEMNYQAIHVKYYVFIVFLR